MAEDTTTVSAEDDIADVSLLDDNTSDVATTTDASSDTADTGKDDAADDSKTTDGQSADKGDAKGTEATDDSQDASGDKASTDDKASDNQDADKQADQQTPEQAREEQRLRAQREYQERQRTKSNVAQQLDSSFGPKTEEELVEEGMQPADAKLEAFKQEMAYKEQRAQVAELNAGMQSDAVNVMHDFPIFDPNSKSFDKDFTEMVNQQYKVAARVQTTEVMDPRTNQASQIVTNAEVPLYDFYQQMANIYGRGTSKGAEQGQAEMQQMLSRTENPGGSSSTSGNGNTLADLEERLGDVAIA